MYVFGLRKLFYKPRMPKADKPTVWCALSSVKRRLSAL